MRETGEIYRQAADGILGMGNNANALHSQVGGAWRRQGPHTSCACWLCTLRWVAVLRMVCPADSWHPPNPTPRSSLPAVRSTVCSPSASASPPAARCCSVMWRRRVASRCLTRRCCQAPRPTMSCGWRPSALGGNPCASSRWVLCLQLCTGWRSRPLLRMLMAHLLQPRYRQVTLFGHTPTLNCTRTPQLCAPPAGNLCQGLWDSV